MIEKYWLACTVNQIGISGIRRLLRRWNKPEVIWKKGKEELIREAGMRERTAERLIQMKTDRDWESEYRNLERQKIRFLTPEDPSYPKRLAVLADAPYGLFVRGDLPAEETKAVGIVGARQCSEYGRAVAGRLGETLAAHNVNVISGLAKGIDSAGHFGALRGGGSTYAVLGCGAEICYPPANRQLYGKIEKQGGLLSEYPPGTPPYPQNFPLRNRIISGLCDALVVVEAKEKSGSLITSDIALEQGKDIYAVPGRVGDALSVGCNRLIRQGAGIVLSPEDFLEELGIYTDKKSSFGNFSKNILEKEEMLVYSVLDLQPRHINEIMNAACLDAAECIRLLSKLEDKGYIRETFHNYYIRS